MANLEHMSFSSEQLISQVLEMKAGAENKIKTLEEMKKKAQELIDSQTKFIEDVNQKIEDYIVILHSLDELLNDPTFDLVGFSYKVKQIKAKGDVIEEYMVVQATKVFTGEKEPEDVFVVSYERG